ncbi:hypothetical protein LCGC14_0547910 [marine sediment metagenome]|uniref:Uncharacterized protein n=1 Tax=marine sediment metagenome TaxID=412755 RepID=A0A0F9RVP3_9ZZZZ
MKSTKGIKCTQIIRIDGKKEYCDRITELLGGYYWCKFCESYACDTVTGGLIHE